MDFRIIKISELSGSETSIYTVILEGDKVSLFDKFLLENKENYGDEIIDILKRIRGIAYKLGAREQFFKLNEGKPGDGVCALYDEPDKKLRLFCIRYGRCILILGGGGEKTDDIIAWQDNEKLSKEAKLMILISKTITKELKDKYSEIKFSPEGNKLLGDLNFQSDE